MTREPLIPKYTFLPRKQEGLRRKWDKSRKTHFQEQRPKQEWKDNKTKILTDKKTGGIVKETTHNSAMYCSSYPLWPWT